MDWIHCNICFRQPLKEKPFSLTSCGHMYCVDCLGNGTENGTCKVCNTTCSSIQLVPDMKPEVREFFAEPEEILSKMMLVLNFQKQHRMKLTTHWISLNRNYQNAKGEVQRLQQISEKMYTHLKDLYKENKALKSALVNSAEKNSPFRTPIPMIPVQCSSARSNMSRPHHTSIHSSQDFKSNLVTPLRVSKQRYSVSSNRIGSQHKMNGFVGGQNNIFVGASAFLTPPLDTPGSKYKYSQSEDPHHPYFNSNKCMM